MKKKTIYYFTNIFPSYRKELWKGLLGSSTIDFNIFFSNQNYRGIGVNPLDSIFSDIEKKKLHFMTKISSNLVQHRIITFEAHFKI